MVHIRMQILLWFTQKCLNSCIFYNYFKYVSSQQHTIGVDENDFGYFVYLLVCQVQHGMDNATNCSFVIYLLIS